MYSRFIKRLVDILLSAVLFIIILPVFATLAFLIKVLSPGPIIFRQTRTGLHGKNFTIYKFRTMECTNDVNDASRENQLTTIGKYIRTLSLDEIPQLINVLKGDMSFIGPRPWITEYFTCMTETQRIRVSVRPGMTGLAQVNGRNNLTIHEKLDFDLKYVQKISFIRDLKIIVLTFGTIFIKSSSSKIEKIGIHEELNVLRGQQEYLEELWDTQTA